MVSLDTHFVGMTGFEPATLRPPDVYATRLRHIPIDVLWRTFKKARLAFFNWDLQVVQFTLSEVEVPNSKFQIPNSKFQIPKKERQK